MAMVIKVGQESN